MKQNPFDEVISSPESEVELLIDADYLAYQIGGLSQHRDQPPHVDAEWICLDDERDEWRWVEPAGLVDWKVRNELDKLLELFDTERYRVYLTGSGNFREEVAVTKPYKGTRTALKPYYFQRIRDLLVNEYGAEVITGWEADDQVSIEQMQCPHTTVIVSNDKDLKNTPGYLYSPYKKELMRIHPCYSQYHFYKQMVVGDNVDNIPGLPRRGIKFFEDLIKKYSRDGDFRKVIEDIREEYRAKDPTFALMREQAELLHMLRHPDPMFGDYQAVLWEQDAPGVDDVVLENAIHLYGPYYEHTSN